MDGNVIAERYSERWRQDRIFPDRLGFYAGATILGRITIGRGSTIGGNVWVTQHVPPNSIVTQATARNKPR